MKQAGAAAVLRQRHIKRIKQAVRQAGGTGSFQRIPVDMIEPNPWNPNVVDPEEMIKLRKGIEEMYRVHGSIPPIVVRPHPDDPTGKFQIIDGKHRWDIVKGDGKKHKRIAGEIDAFVINADDSLAKRLTLNLNYLRGEPDKAKEAEILSDLVQSGFTPDQLAESLYLDPEEIIDSLTAYGKNDALEQVLKQEIHSKEEDKGEEDEIQDDDVFLDLTFKVSGSQAKVIEKELHRIGSKLKGRNARGRALEFMAVQSGQSKLPEDLC